MDFTLSVDSIPSPYDGMHPVVFQVRNAPPLTNLTFSFPTNIITGSGGSQITTEGIAGDGSGGYPNTFTDASGSLDFIFNADPLAKYLQASISHGWILPAGTYQFGVRITSDTTITWTYVDFTITGVSQRILRKRKK